MKKKNCADCTTILLLVKYWRRQMSNLSFILLPSPTLVESLPRQPRGQCLRPVEIFLPLEIHSAKKDVSRQPVSSEKLFFGKSHKALEMIAGKAPWSGIDLKGLMPGKNNGQFPISFLPTISVQYIYFCGCRVVRF